MSFSNIRRLGVFSFAFISLFLSPQPTHAYTLEGQSWAAGSQIVIHLSLGNPPSPLQDGNTSYNDAVLPAIGYWNNTMQQVQVEAVIDSVPTASGDHVNSVSFASTVFGQAFGKTTLAVTYYKYQGGMMVESDTLFNTAQTFNSYRGPLQYPPHGYAIADIRRVFLHELGHTLGLGHPDTAGQHVTAIMNSITSDVETLQSDDISGIESLYLTPAPTPTPAPATVSHLANISTRANVTTNDGVLIGGFIISGTQPKKLILRAIGPSLGASGVSGAMADPVLELHDSSGAVLSTNDDWIASSQQADISASGVAPSDPKESAIIATLSPGSYTAIVRGNGNTSGVALVEAYELDSTSTRLANISTRGNVGLNDQALIAGLIVQGGSLKNVIVRVLGPSLGGEVSGALSNPYLELHDSSGNLISSNDDWSSGTQVSQINATGLAPSNSAESALIVTIAPGNYTAVVQGTNNQTGIGLVEVFDLDP